MTDAKHTPTPWVFIPIKRHLYNDHFKYRVEGEDGFSPCCIYTDGTKNKGTTEANAAFIVKACNNHDALVDALKAIADRTTVQMLCPTAPSQDAADGFKMGAIQATDECALIADQALADATK